jgi:hypothetical protein
VAIEHSVRAAKPQIDELKGRRCISAAALKWQVGEKCGRRRQKAGAVAGGGLFESEQVQRPSRPHRSLGGLRMRWLVCLEAKRLASRVRACSHRSGSSIVTHVKRRTDVVLACERLEEVLRFGVGFQTSNWVMVLEDFKPLPGCGSIRALRWILSTPARCLVGIFTVDSSVCLRVEDSMRGSVVVREREDPGDSAVDACSRWRLIGCSGLVFDMGKNSASGSESFLAC